MPQGTCSLDGCSRSGKITFGWCQAHYRRWKKTGDVGAAEIGFRSKNSSPTCAVDGCQRGGKIRRGWCSVHYSRWRESGDVRADMPIVVPARGKPDHCVADGCARAVLCRGLCSLHYQRLMARGTTEPRAKVVKVCRVADCDRAVHCRDLCIRHYRRFQAYGDPLGSKPRPEKPARCQSEGCPKQPVARGFCDKHYARWRVHGDAAVNNRRIPKSDRGICIKDRCWDVAEANSRCGKHNRAYLHYLSLSGRVAELDVTTDIKAAFDARVSRSSSGCWLWTGYVNPAGYGMCPVGKRQSVLAHRISWRLAGRSLRRGMHLDHLCRVRNCVNPEHLEQVDPGTNVRRGLGPSGRNFRKSHCRNGHEFDLLNTYYPPSGGRHCRTCIRSSNRRQVNVLVAG